VHRADLKLLEGDALSPELSRRINADPEVPACTLEHEVSKAFRHEVELGAAGENVGEANLPGGRLGLGAACGSQ